MIFAKSYLAAAAIAAYTMVKSGATDFTVAPATASTDKVWGVNDDVDRVAGDPCDVVHFGEAKVVAGAAFAAGDLLMSDASGRAITAAAAAGTNVRTVGYARQSANAVGDIVEIIVQPSVFQG